MTEVVELKQKYKWKTIPLIFVKGNFVGGYSDFLEKVTKK
jgi:glutaredoxin-related protein